MKDLERVLYYAIDRKNDCKRFEDISCFSDEFKTQLLGMKEAYDDIVNYIYHLLHLEPKNTGDKGLEDKKQSTFTNTGYIKLKNCKDCSFYKESLSQEKIYAGDSPCSWCPYLQETCSSNTQENEFYSKENKDE